MSDKQKPARIFTNSRGGARGRGGGDWRGAPTSRGGSDWRGAPTSRGGGDWQRADWSKKSNVKIKAQPKRVESAVEEESEPIKDFCLSDLPLGVCSSGNAGVDDAVRGLRLLHVAKLRQLQSQVNELMRRVQKKTANPITDVKLGRVGR